MKKFAALMMIVLVLAAAIAVVSIHAQTSVQPRMTEVPFNIEPNNPVPMTLHWNKDGQSFYYFNWGVKPTAGYRLEFGGIEKKVMTIRAVAPTSEDIVAQVQTYPKLMLVFPKGKYAYRVVDQFGREMKSAFQPERKPISFKVVFPFGEKWASRNVWRDSSGENAGKTKVEIAAEALMAQSEMGFYAGQGLRLLGFTIKGNKCEVKFNPSYERLGYKEKATLTEAIQKTIRGIKVKKVRKVEIVTENAMTTN